MEKLTLIGVFAAITLLTLVLIGYLLPQEKPNQWADFTTQTGYWWNSSYLLRLPINCTGATSSVLTVVNGTSGVMLTGGTTKQFVRIQCTGGPYIYYNNETSWTVANDTTEYNYEVISGNRTSRNPLALYDGVRLISSYPCENSGNDGVGVNNLTSVGTQGYNTSGYVGKSCRYNGTSNYLEKTSGVTRMWVANNDSTQCAAVRFTTITSTVNYFFMAGESTWTTNGASKQLGIRNTSWIIETRTFNVYPMASNGGVNSWKVLCFTYNGTTRNSSVYVNGVYNSSAIHSGNLTFNPQRIRIGTDFNTTRFSGEVDELLLYNKSLSASDVLTIYNNYARVQGYGTTLALENNSALNITYGANITSIYFNATTFVQKNVSAQNQSATNPLFYVNSTGMGYTNITCNQTPTIGGLTVKCANAFNASRALNCTTASYLYNTSVSNYTSVWCWADFYFPRNRSGVVNITFGGT